MVPPQGANLLVDPRAAQRRERRESATRRHPPARRTTTNVRLLQALQAPCHKGRRRLPGRPEPARPRGDGALKKFRDGVTPAQAPRNYFKDVLPPERVDQKPMTAKDFAK